MKSNSLKLVAAIALAACAGTALAQGKPAFTGWGVGLSVSSSQNKFAPNSSIQLTSGQFDATTTPVALIGSYGFAMGSQWVGTVGLSYDLGNTDFGTAVISGNSSPTTLTGKNHLSVSFAPGYRVGDKGLVYAKLAAHQTTFNQQQPGFADVTKTISGTGLGLGYAMALSPAMELRAEYEAVEYDKQTGGVPKQNRLGLSLLYTF